MKNRSTSNGLVTPQQGQSVLPQNLSSNSGEITTFVEIYFIRPLGLIVARLANTLRMTPTQVTIIGAFVGILAGAMLYDERLGPVAFALLMLHGIIDSADGQLARMTGQVTELGRVLDGASGYVTHISIFITIAIGVIHHTGNGFVFVWMLLAGFATVIHAQMYEYYRPLYVRIVNEGRMPQSDPGAVPLWIRWLYSGYLVVQRCLVGLHQRVLARLTDRSIAGFIRDEDRSKYQQRYYWTACAWSLLGDNMRFFVVGLLACMHRVDLFLAFVLGPMNLILIALALWQRNSDRKFLADIKSG